MGHGYSSEGAFNTSIVKIDKSANSAGLNSSLVLSWAWGLVWGLHTVDVPPAAILMDESAHLVHGLSAPVDLALGHKLHHTGIGRLLGVAHLQAHPLDGVGV
jgi:hypothetical protein